MLPATRSINLPVVNERTDPAQRERLAAALPEAYAAVLREAKPDAAIAEQVAAYAVLTAPKAERPVGTIAGPLGRGGKVDSAAGRLIADSQLAATKGEGAQVAFMNPGGIRANLECAAPPCTVTFRPSPCNPSATAWWVMTLTAQPGRARVAATLKEQRAHVAQPSEGFSYTWQSDARAWCGASRCCRRRSIA